MRSLAPGRFLLTAGTLYLIWIVLSGHFHARYLIIGAVTAVLVTAGLLPRRGAIPHPPFPVLRFIAFTPWLIGQIILSNLRVARTALAPLSAIQPQFIRIEPGMGAANADERALTVLGCAITLTPGTLTVDVATRELYVHALDSESARDIHEGTLARRVARMFGA